MSKAGQILERVAHLGASVRESFGKFRRKRSEPVRDRAALRRFLETRSSYVAQMSLYGYLRTRAGMLYPQLFNEDVFVRSINIAKWHVWLACLSDLAVYTGGLLAQRSHAPSSRAGTLVTELVFSILDETGVPADADADYAGHADRVRARLTGCDWDRVTDDEGPFKESPPSVVRWAPIVDNLKELDEEIVRNSVRFRWQEVRRDLREHLDAEAVLQEND